MRKTHRSGFTILEVLVSMLILALLSVALIVIYRSGLTEAEHATGRMALQQQARLLMDKMVPMITTAAKVSQDDNTDPLFFPPADQAGYNRIDWRSSVDLFNQMAVVGSATDFRNVVQYAYRISWDGDFSVRLSELDINSLLPTARAPQVLGQHIDQLTFTRSLQSIVIVTIRTSNRVGGVVHTGDLMRRYDLSADADNVNGGDRRTYALESALILPVYTGINR